MNPQIVLDFWFKESTPAQWFARNDDFDSMIKTRFLESYQKAASGALDEWASSPSGALALVIILDQFSRNMFRESRQAFATDAKALEIARRAIASGLDNKLDTPAMKKFLYMPFMHSEELAVQEEGMRLFEQLNDPMTMEYAVQHRDVIARFGRFPHRNEVLERESTPEEIAFMARGQ